MSISVASHTQVTDLSGETNTTKADKIEHTKKVTQVSSATLAENNHYILDENICSLVYAKHQAEAAAPAAASERRRAAEEKMENLKKALKKFKICPNGLTVLEMKELVVAVTNATDSPVKSRKADLQAQLYREPWYGRVQTMANDLTVNSKSDNNESVANKAAEGLLVALFGYPAVPTVEVMFHFWFNKNNELFLPPSLLLKMQKKGLWLSILIV